MPALAHRQETPSILPAQMAGSHYPQAIDELSDLLTRSLVYARSSSISAPKLVITPLSSLEDSGVVAASAFANLANRRGLIRRVIVMGPARRSALRGIAVPSHSGFSTPLGVVPIDARNVTRLKKLTEVTEDDRGFEQEAAIEAVLPLLQVCLENFELTPLIVGNVYPDVVAKVLEMIWGGPETLIVITSDLSQHLADERVRASDIDTRGMIETLAGAGLSTTNADGHRLIAGALLRAAALDLRVTGLDFRTSPMAAGKAKGHGAFAFEPAQTARLSSAERHYLLKTAAQAVRAAADNPLLSPRPMNFARLPMTLSAVRATTVRLERDGVMRGEAGGLRPFRALLTDATSRAIEAAAADARFGAVTPDELGRLTLTISITSTPRLLAHRTIEALVADLMPGRDGLLLEEGSRRAVALPHVWNNIADPALFIAALKQRAGLAGDYTSPTMTIRKFCAETFSAPIGSLLAD